MVTVEDYVQRGEELSGRVFRTKGIIPLNYRIQEVFTDKRGQIRVAIDIEWYGKLVPFGDGGLLENHLSNEENPSFVDCFDF